MRILVVYAHPLADSYAAALCRAVVETLGKRGHAIDVCDLYEEGFDPVLSAGERRAYDKSPENEAAVAAHVERLRRSDGIILVFPSWWYGMPAILKGYFDRVWLPGVAFEFGPGAIRPVLTNIRLFGVVTTSGAPEWFTRIYVGDPSRRVLMRGLARLLAPRSERIWLSLYGIDTATPARREAFIERVRARLARIAA